MASVRIQNGPNRDQVFVLKGGELVGRDPQNAIQVFAPGVSRKHFQFNCEGGKFFVQDLGSSNGTYVNNQRIQKHLLIESDIITVGGINLRFSNANDGAAPMGPSPLSLSSEEVAIGAFGASPGGFGASPGGFGVSPGAAGAAVAQQPGSSSALVLKEDEEESGEDYSLDASIVFDAKTIAATKTEDKVEALQKRLTIMFEISQLLAGSHSIDEMLVLVLDKLFSVFPQADRGFILLGNSVEELKPVAVRNRNKEGGKKDDVQISRTIARKVCSEKQAIISQNAMEDDRFSGGMSILNFRILSMACAPLLFRDEVFGLIQVDTQDRAKKFTPDDLNLLAGIAALAAIFLKNRKEAEARQNLMRYFSPTVANDVANGKIDLKLGGDTKVGTVFFSDVIGFTSMSEGMTAPQVVEKINRYMKHMVEVVFRYEGSVDKFIGDCIMAVWGVPMEIPDEAAKALSAGIEMQNAVFLFNAELASEGQTPIHMGIGLNSGNFVAGNMGSELRMEYTVIGDNVNLAQRVESKSGRGMVLCSESTYERCDGRALGVKLKPVNLKGKGKAVTTYVCRGMEQNPGVFMTTIPVAVNAWSPECQRGLIVKVKVGPDGNCLGLILFATRPEGARLKLECYAPELPRFSFEFVPQGDVKVQSAAGMCLKGIFSIKGTPLEELFAKRVVVSDKSPDDIPRSQTPA
jgi:adenylate cyclase